MTDGFPSQKLAVGADSQVVPGGLIPRPGRLAGGFPGGFYEEMCGFDEKMVDLNRFFFTGKNMVWISAHF